MTLTPHRPAAARWRDVPGRLDAAAFSRVARGHSPLLDRVLPPLTHSANHGRLWLGLSALLAATGGSRRRAAVRGLTSLGLASLVANGPVKLAARRGRPGLGPVPVLRQLHRQPTTSSFPSGHSASAAAFAVGVALECPAAALPVAALAAGVAYGRVHTGVHYPGDVLAGLALGAGAALAVRRVWPVRPDRPATAAPASGEAPALADGAGLVLVVNESAGSGDGADALQEQLARELPEAEVVRCDGARVTACLEEAAGRARVLGVAGGDGTVNCAAGLALAAGIPLAVFPGGTLNHFAGELGIRTAADVTAAVRRGEAASVTVGSSAPDGDGGLFLNTFALGVYPELVAARERREGDLGKWPALLWALLRVLPGARPVEVEVAGQPRRLWTLFAGNGHYHPDGFAPSWRERLDDTCVDVRLLDADRPLSRTRLLLAVLTGQLGRTAVYSQRLTNELSVQSRSGGLRLARDGEVEEGPDRLVLRVAERRLVVYRPAPA